MPDIEKKLTQKKRTPELRIYAVPEKLKEQVNNIARNHGLSESDFLKSEITKIVDSYPEKMRKRLYY